MKAFIFILLFIASCFCATAQDPLYKLYNNNNGLSNNTIYDVKADDDGFIWLTHNKGISRFNGKTFDNYFTQGEQGNAVSNLLCYKKQIYCQDFNGNFYQLIQEKLQKIKEVPSSGNFYLAGIVNGNLIQIGTTYYGVFNLENKSYKKVFSKDTLGITACYFKDSFAISGFSSIYLNSAQSLYSFPTTSIKINRDFRYLIKRNNQFISCDLFSYPYLYNTNSGQPYFNNLPKKLFIHDVVTVDDEVWICTSTGAYCLDENFKLKYSTESLFKDHAISKVYKDKEGGYWFTTLQNGAIYVPNIYNATLYNNYTITAIHHGKNILAGSGENDFINLSKNTIIALGPKHDLFKIKYDATTNLTAVMSDAFYIFENDNLILNTNLAVKDIFFVNKDLWFLSTSAGEYVYTTHREKIPNFIKVVESNSPNIYSINCLNRGKSIVWHEAQQTLYYADGKGLFMQDKNGVKEITNNNQPIYARNLYLLNNKVVAITSNSFYTFTKTKTEKTLQLNGSNNLLIQSSFIYNNKIYYSFKNNIYSIDEQLNPTSIWNNNGNIATDINCFTIDENKLYVALEKGIGLINLKNNITKNSYIPTIALNRFFVNEAQRVFISNTKFAERENNIGFEFASNSYGSLDSFKMYYQLNNEAWVKLQQNNNTHQLYFNKMSANTYQLKIKGIDNHQKETNVLEFDFIITKPFYKSLWFLLIIGLGILLLVIAYYRKAIAREKINNKLFEEKLKLEEELKHSLMASIKSQMNPHFLFNALNTIQSYIYTNEKENASLYLNKFSQLTRNILQQSNNDEINLEEEIISLKLYVELETMRFEDKLSSKFVVNKAIKTDNVFVPSMLIQPYLENAIKHGLLHKRDNRNLLVSFKKVNNTLEVTIDDDGVGRLQSAAINLRKQGSHTSFAINANKKRLDILQSQQAHNISFEIIDKVDENNNSLGTTVKLSLPYKTKQ